LSGESDGYINVQKIKSNAVGTFTDNLDFVKRALRLLVKSDTSANNPSGGGQAMMGRVPITYEDDGSESSQSSDSEEEEEVVVTPAFLAVGKNSQNENAAAEPTVNRRYWAFFYIYNYIIYYIYICQFVRVNIRCRFVQSTYCSVISFPSL
jgi:hypothetical protein